MSLSCCSFGTTGPLPLLALEDHRWGMCCGGPTHRPGSGPRWLQSLSACQLSSLLTTRLSSPALSRIVQGYARSKGKGQLFYINPFLQHQGQIYSFAQASAVAGERRASSLTCMFLGPALSPATRQSVDVDVGVLVCLCVHAHVCVYVFVWGV